MNRQFKTGYVSRFQEARHGYSETTPGLLKMPTGVPSSLDCVKEVQTLSAGKQSKSNRKMLGRKSLFFAQLKSKIKQRQLLSSAGFWRSSVRPGALQELLARLMKQGELSVCNGISTSLCTGERSATYSVRLIHQNRQRCLTPRKSALRSCMFSTGTPSRSTTPQISKYWNGPKSPKHGRHIKSPIEGGRGTPLKPLFAHAASFANEPGLQPTATSNKLRRVGDERQCD